MAEVLGVLDAYALSRHHAFTPGSIAEVERALAEDEFDMRFFSNEFVNEPVFIGNPNGTEEDDGVLTCVVYDAANDASSFLILDAKDFKELARVHLGIKVQAHFHGKFCKAFGDKTCVGL